MKKSKSLFLLSAVSGAVAVAISAAPLVYADSNSPNEGMEEVVVTGTLSRYSALKSSTPILETSRSISIETEQQIIDKGAQSLADALVYSAGVHANSHGFSSRSDNVKVRGLDVPQYQDSLQSLFGSYSSARPDVYTLEQVEVLKGPASVLYGQGSPGGLINVVSKRPKAESSTEVFAEYGSFDRKQLGVDSTGAMSPSGDWLYRVVALARDSDSQVDYVGEDTQVLAPSVSWRPNDDTDITMLLNYSKTHGDVATQFLPVEGTLLPAHNGKKIDHDTYAGEPDFNRYDTENKSMTLVANQRLSDIWTLEATARYIKSTSNYRQAWVDFLGASPELGFLSGERYPYAPGTEFLTDHDKLSRTFYRNDQKTKQGAVDIRFKADFSTGTVDHKLLLGGQYQRVTNASKGYALGGNGLSFNPNTALSEFGGLNIFNPVYGNTASQSVLDEGYVDEGKTKAVDMGLYLNDQLSIDRWRLTAGLRYDKVKTTEVNTKNKDDALSGSLGALYQFDNGLAPYVNYSQSFDPVIGTDDGTATGKPLKPQEGEQYELGVKYQPEGLPIFVTAAYFDTTVTNLNDPTAKVGTVQQQQGESNIRGFELEAQLVLSEDYTLELNATRLDTEDPNGDRLTSVPDTQASVWLGYRPQSGSLFGVKAGLGVRYEGDVYGGVFQSTNHPEPMEIEVPSVTLVDLMLGYEVGQWDLALNVRNLENKEYYATCLGRGECYPGEQRTVIGSVRFKF